MPRTYRRQYSKAIVRAPKKSWNIGHIYSQFSLLNFTENNASASTIAVNSADNNVPTTTVVQIKHVKVYGTVCLQGNVTESGPAQPVQVVSYIMYVPQIVFDNLEASNTTTATFYAAVVKLVRDHPEWIMSMKNLNVKYQGGFPGEKDMTKFVQTSGKLKRNLRSGDRIMHFITYSSVLGTEPNYGRSAYCDYTFSSCDN